MLCWIPSTNLIRPEFATMSDASPKEINRQTELLFGLDDRPGLMKGSVAALGHLAAIVASILTAPLLICGAIGLNPENTRYVLSASLLVSGIATFIQVYRIGNLGCGMIAIQGTSFAFVGPLAYAAPIYAGEIEATILVGKIMGTCAVLGILVMISSFYLDKLRNIITSTVAGTTIFLLGATLLESAIKNLSRVFFTTDGWGHYTITIEALVTVGVILFLMRLKQSLVRVACIPIGLLCGCAVAYILGDYTPGQSEFSSYFFILSPAYFPLQFDLLLFILLLPIFLVSLTETIGDITATSLVSNQPISGPVYVKRLRGGVMADGFNTSLASVLGTFPNTTFSQNNAVIRITGVASRQVGIILAIFLIILGSTPHISQLFLHIPGAVLHAGTGLLFSMIAYTGLSIVRIQNHGKSFHVLAISCICAFALREVAPLIAADTFSFAEYSAIVLGFPVASGAIIAVILDRKMQSEDVRKTKG
ncbi:MAG: hypothetical protein CMK30_06550 [Porticoccaceae bacterium]|nr:hypothetical protein [Porticoccaceae bacterium]